MVVFGVNPRQNGDWTNYSNDLIVRLWRDELLQHQPRVVWRLMLFAVTQPGLDVKQETASVFAEVAQTMDLLLRGKKPDLALMHIAHKKHYYHRCAVTLMGVASWHEPPEAMHNRFKKKLAEILESESNSPHHYFIQRGRDYQS